MGRLLRAGIFTVALLLLGCNDGEERVLKYGSNNVKSIEHIDKNGKLTGEKKNYTYDGELESIEHYKKGKKQGEQILFFTDGSKKINIKYWYENGKRTGTLFLDREGNPTKRLGYYKNHD